MALESKITILDLDDFSFEHVLRKVYLIDLCRLGDVNEAMRNAARCEFLRRYSKKKFKLRLSEIEPIQSDEIGDIVLIYSFKYIFNFLRCFGDLLETLTVSFLDDSLTKVSRVMTYLCLYCSKSLESVCFDNLKVDIFGEDALSLLRVKKVKFVSCIFGVSLRDIKKVFPNVGNI